MGPGKVTQGPKGGVNIINMSSYFHPKEERRVVIVSYLGVRDGRREGRFTPLFFFLLKMYCTQCAALQVY